MGMEHDAAADGRAAHVPNDEVAAPTRCGKLGNHIIPEPLIFLSRASERCLDRDRSGATSAIGPLAVLRRNESGTDGRRCGHGAVRVRIKRDASVALECVGQAPGLCDYRAGTLLGGFTVFWRGRDARCRRSRGVRQNERDGEENQYEATEHVELGHHFSRFLGEIATLPSRPGIRARDSKLIVRNLHEARKQEQRLLAADICADCGPTPAAASDPTANPSRVANVEPVVQRAGSAGEIEEFAFLLHLVADPCLALNG